MSSASDKPRECHYCPDGLLLCPDHYRQRYGHPHAFGTTFRAVCAWCAEAEQIGNAATAAYELDADLPEAEPFRGNDSCS